MNLIESYLTKNPYYAKNQNPTDVRYKNYQKAGAKGIMLHSVGTPQPDATVFVRKWNNPTYEAACVHAFIDANNGAIYNTMPWGYRAPHCGGDANNTHIGVEMCEPDCIKYIGGATFTCSDTEKARAMVKRTYDAAVELFAYLCQMYNLDPLADGVIISHKEGHLRGVASNHADPEHLWTQLKTGDTMDGFRKDVAKAMEQKPEEESEMRYNTLGDLKADKNGAKYYLPTVEKLMEKDILRGRGGTGDNTIIDLGEDALRVLVTLDRAGVYGD